VKNSALNVIDAYRADAAERAVAMSNLTRENHALLQANGMYLRGLVGAQDREQSAFVFGALFGYAANGLVMAVGDFSWEAIVVYGLIGAVGLLGRWFIRRAFKRTEAK
jgi:hypothetical protein